MGLTLVPQRGEDARKDFQEGKPGLLSFILRGVMSPAEKEK